MTIPTFNRGDVVAKIKPWYYHGKPDDCEVRHTGVVIGLGNMGYISVRWLEGPPTSVHPWDIRKMHIPF